MNLKKKHNKCFVLPLFSTKCVAFANWARFSLYLAALKQQNSRLFPFFFYIFLSFSILLSAMPFKRSLHNNFALKSFIKLFSQIVLNQRRDVMLVRINCTKCFWGCSYVTPHLLWRHHASEVTLACAAFRNSLRFPHILYLIMNKEPAYTGSGPWSFYVT